MTTIVDIRRQKVKVRGILENEPIDSKHVA